MLLENKQAIVTGAASGIGREVALLFAREGARVTIADVNAAGLEETAGMIGGLATVQPYNATEMGSCRALVESCAADGLDILCNVAGVMSWGPAESYPIAEFEKTMAINVTSVFALCQAALPHLVRTRGNIVNVASTAALAGHPYMAAYSASKFAVAAITKSIALEFAARDVRANAVCPGFVRTPLASTKPFDQEALDWNLVMRNTAKLGSGPCEATDMAEAVAFLASNKARKITGILLAVDAGQTAG